MKNIKDYIMIEMLMNVKIVKASVGTLGQRVVSYYQLLCLNVELIFERFFSFVHLLNTIKFLAMRTVMRNRKYVPKFSANLEREQSELQYNENLLVISNCLCVGTTLIKRILKILFYSFTRV